MARLLLPTRNRPTSLRGVLSYLAHFYPGTELIIADGSTPAHQPQNAENVKSFSDSLVIDYRAYPDDITALDRLVDVVENESDEFFLMASDDDFPVIEVFRKGEQFLRNNPNYSVAMAACVGLTMKNDSLISAGFKPARPLTANCPAQRMRNFSMWPFPTTYALTRRDVLLERFERARTMFVSGLYDFTVGLHDTALGAIKSYPTIGYFFTRNYRHSYLRPGDKLNFLRQGEVVLKIRDTIVEDLVRMSNKNRSQAESLAELLIKRRISHITGGAAHTHPGFVDRGCFKNKIVQQQMKIFHDMFTPETEAREYFEEKLMFISRALKDNVNSSDNEGEEKKYETLDAQLETARK